MLRSKLGLIVLALLGTMHSLCPMRKRDRSCSPPRAGRRSPSPEARTRRSPSPEFPATQAASARRSPSPDTRPRPMQRRFDIGVAAANQAHRPFVVHLGLGRPGIFVTRPHVVSETLVEALASVALDLVGMRLFSYEREILLMSVDSLNQQDGQGRTILHNVIRSLRFTVAEKKRLLQVLCSRREININIPDHDGNTPMHLAAFAGHEELVRVLLYTSRITAVDLTMQNRRGQTAAALAHERGHREIALLLHRR